MNKLTIFHAAILAGFVAGATNFGVGYAVAKISGVVAQHEREKEDRENEKILQDWREKKSLTAPRNH